MFMEVSHYCSTNKYIASCLVHLTRELEDTLNSKPFYGETDVIRMILLLEEAKVMEFIMMGIETLGRGATYSRLMLTLATV